MQFSLQIPLAPDMASWRDKVRRAQDVGHYPVSVPEWLSPGSPNTPGFRSSLLQRRLWYHGRRHRRFPCALVGALAMIGEKPLSLHDRSGISPSPKARRWPLPGQCLWPSCAIGPGAQALEEGT